MKKEEISIIVDRKDNIVGYVPRSEARKKKLRHRGSAIFVENSKGELLIHKRTKAKAVFPGYYDVTFGGLHVKGETFEENAKRELEEETGLKNFKIKFLFKSRYEGKESKRTSYNKIISYVFFVESNGPFKFQKEEVEKAFFVSKKELKKLIKKETFCPDGLKLLKQYLKLNKEKTEEYMDVVDTNDKLLYSAPASFVREKKLLHRGISVIVQNSKKEILVNKRHKKKYYFPGYYDFVISGGVKSGESYKEAAIREIKEELGIKNPKPTFLFNHRFKNEEQRTNVLVSVYHCRTDGPFKFQKEEIEKAFFVPLSELSKIEKKEKFCDGSIDILKKYLKLNRSK
jgi:isopentenyldiphosphate isomerase